MTNSKLLPHFFNTSLITLFFVALSFISSEFAIAAFYSFIFIMTLSMPWIIRVPTIFTISTFFDIYNSQFIGVSFIQFIATYMAIIKFRTLLLNCRIIFGIYFFLLLVLASEFLSFIIAFVSRNSFDFYMHFARISMATFLCCAYCLIAFIVRKIRDKYAR
jgi:hypothetical protein